MRVQTAPRTPSGTAAGLFRRHYSGRRNAGGLAVDQRLAQVADIRNPSRPLAARQAPGHPRLGHRVDDGPDPRLFAFLGARDFGGDVVERFMYVSDELTAFAVVAPVGKWSGAERLSTCPQVFSPSPVGPPDIEIDRDRLGPLRTMRRRPHLLGGESRRRTPRGVLGTARMHSIVRDLAGVEPVLIDRRDEGLRPPVQLPAVPSASHPLAPLRPRQSLLLQRVQRDGAQTGAASCRAALPGRLSTSQGWQASAHEQASRRWETRRSVE